MTQFPANSPQIVIEDPELHRFRVIQQFAIDDISNTVFWKISTVKYVWVASK